MSFAKAAGNRGFTLIEVLVALVLASLLAGVIFQVVRGQARFASVQSAQQEVQQNARGAVEIIASELRATPDSALVEATATSITFLLPRAWGVSCGGTGTSLNVVFPTVPDTSIMWALNDASGVLANTSTTAVPNWQPMPSSTFTGRATVTSITAQNPKLGAAGNACADSVRTDSTPARVRGRALNGVGLPTVPKGNTVYLYQIVRYDVAAVSGEYWIRRSNGLPGESNQQPLAGPISSAAAMSFTYYKADGTQFSPGTNLALLRQVARIGVKVVAHSRTKGRAELADSVQTSVLLRN